MLLPLIPSTCETHGGKRHDSRLAKVFDVAGQFDRGELIPGLVCKPDFITEDEEAKLLARIDEAEWSEELHRRVQHFGWRYDYRQRQIDETMRLGDLPAWAEELARRLVSEGLVDARPDQLIVNEYCGNQGITRHIDQPRSFAGQVATISLLETWGMVFRRRGGKDKVEKRLARRSVAVLTGEARYQWTHEIPARNTEPAGPGASGRVERKRRISLTFRRVVPGGRVGRRRDVVPVRTRRLKPVR